MPTGPTITVTGISLATLKSKNELPLFTEAVSAGFPSPADDFIEKNLDLNDCFIKHPAATFFVRVSGNSMCDAGIRSGDLLIVDRAIEPSNNRVVVAVVNGEFTVKRIRKRGSKVYLMPENRNFKPIEVTDEMDCYVWGVVTNVIHSV